MAQYHIYHSYGPNAFQEVDVQPRKYAGFVEATSLDYAYYLSQNFDEPWNPTNPCRSTSVGDVIQSDDGFFMVCSFGFKQVDAADAPEIQLSQKDLEIANNVALAQHMLDNPEDYGLI